MSWVSVTSGNMLLHWWPLNKETHIFPVLGHFTQPSLGSLSVSVCVSASLSLQRNTSSSSFLRKVTLEENFLNLVYLYSIFYWQNCLIQHIRLENIFPKNFENTASRVAEVQAAVGSMLCVRSLSHSLSASLPGRPWDSLCDPVF